MRLFVAVDLPQPTRSSLATWADEAAPAEVRRVPEQNLHITLVFLGARSQADAGAAGAVLGELARPLAQLRTAGALWLPPRRPAVLTVAVAHGPDLAELQGDLGAALADAIGLAPERRPFRAHVTVGRIRRGTRISTRVALDPPALEFAAEALTLYRSHSGPQGSRYEPLARVGLA